MCTIDNLKDGVYCFSFSNNSYMVWSTAEAFALALGLFSEGKMLLSELEKID